MAIVGVFPISGSTFSWDDSAETGSYVIAFILIDATVTGIDCDGTAMTLLASVTAGTGTLYAYGMPSVPSPPDVGWKLRTFTAAITGTATGVSCWGLSYPGRSSASATTASYSNGGPRRNPNNVAVTVSGGLVVQAIACLSLGGNPFIASGPGGAMYGGNGIRNGSYGASYSLFIDSTDVSTTFTFSVNETTGGIQVTLN